MRALHATIVCLGLVSSLPAEAHSAGENWEEGRKVYALAEAGEAYCPDIKARPGLRLGIKNIFGYSPSTDAELKELDAAKGVLFALFKRMSSRAAACEALMQEYGPGGSTQLFEFK